MKKNTFLTLYLLALYLQCTAQAPLFSYNLYHYNPAAAATSSNWAATMDYNGYVPNIYGLGSSSNLNVEKRFPKYHSALGFNTHRFVLGEGYLFRQDINLSYSYQWTLSQKENSPILAFGAESGLSGRLIGVTGGFYTYNYLYNLFPNLNAGVHFYSD